MGEKRNDVVALMETLARRKEHARENDDAEWFVGSRKGRERWVWSLKESVGRR